jgi:hypothetical protein
MGRDDLPIAYGLAIARFPREESLGGVPGEARGLPLTYRVWGDGRGGDHGAAVFSGRALDHEGSSRSEGSARGSTGPDPTFCADTSLGARAGGASRRCSVRRGYTARCAVVSGRWY